MKKMMVDNDIKRMQTMYKGMGMTSEDTTAGYSVEGDIAKLQKRNMKLRQMTQPVRDEMKASGGKNYRKSALDFALNLLRGGKK